MAQKKSKAKQKTADKDVSKDRTPPEPAPVPPAESAPEEQPIPVPEPLPLPVPPPTAKQLLNHATGSTSHEHTADHPVNEQVEAAAGDGWGTGDGGDWRGVGGSKEKWGNDNEWSGDGADYESEGHDELKEYGDHDNFGLGQTDTTPAQTVEQPSLGQPVQDHVPTQATSIPATPFPSPPSPAPSPPHSAVSAHPVQSSESAGHTKVATSQNKNQTPLQSEPKRYTFASSMANRNRPASQPASSSPPSSRPSYFWAPKQPLPQKQSMSTTKGQHNTQLSNLTPWGQPKSVDPWGDPKSQPMPRPPATPLSAPQATTQKRPAWYDWGRQPQTAARTLPTDRSTGYTYDYDSDDDEYTDDGYTDDNDDRTHDVWGTFPNANHGWVPDLRKVNPALLGSDKGMSAGTKPVLSQVEHAQIVNVMLNDVYQGYSSVQKHHSQAPRHYPEPSHHQLEETWRLKQIAEEQRRLATEMAHQQQKTYKQHYDQGVGKSSKKHKHKGDEWHDGNDWSASGGWVNDGWGQNDNGWSQSGNNGRDQSGNDWGRGGGNSWGNGGEDKGNNSDGDGWNNGGNTWGDNGGNTWGDNGGNTWGNNGGNTWGNNGDTWDNNGGDDWNHDGGDNWDNDSGDGRGNNGGDNGGRGNAGRVKGDSKKDKRHGGTWAGYDNGWSTNKGLDDWGASDWDKNDGWGDGNDKQTLHETEEDNWGEAGRHHVLTDSAQVPMSKTFVQAMSPEDHREINSSTSLKLGLPPGTINESNNQAFEPASRAIFGRERVARERIHWMYSPENESQVISILFWIQRMESHLAILGLLKFLETKELGALFVNVTFRLNNYPDKPVFDWLGYKQVQVSADQILQGSILATDPADQTVIFVYLLSRTGNSVAMWRRKLQVPKEVRQKHLQALKKVKAGLQLDKELIYDDELPPSDQGRPTKREKLPTKSKQATKAEPAKLTKSALKTHQRGQSLPTVPKKKRKWWQILRFAD